MPYLIIWWSNPCLKIVDLFADYPLWAAIFWQDLISFFSGRNAWYEKTTTESSGLNNQLHIEFYWDWLSQFSSSKNPGMWHWFGDMPTSLNKIIRISILVYAARLGKMILAVFGNQLRFAETIIIHRLHWLAMCARPVFVFNRNLRGTFLAISVGTKILMKAIIYPQKDDA